MENKAIAHISPFRLKWGDLKGLSENQKAVFSLVSFVVSEVNALRRICLFALNSVEDKPNVDRAAEIQRNMLLRVLTAKIFEFQQFFEKVNNNSTFDQGVNDVFDKFAVEMTSYRSGKGYQVAKTIRNKLSNHYDIEFVAKASRNVADETDCTLYFSNLSGNQYFPMGDAVAFAHAFTGRQGQNSFNIDDDADLDDWVDWTSRVSDCMNRIHKEIFVNCIYPRVEGRKARRVTEYIDLDLVGVIDQFRLPIFLRVAS